MRKIVIAAAAGLTLGAGAAAVAAPPAQDVSHMRHPNLQAAQAFAEKAFEKVTAAQRANEFDLNGHAAHAKELLDQASNELKQAAITSNRNGR